MKTILVPTDFSRYAKKALDYAISIAKKTNGRIILIHAHNMVYISPDVPMTYYSEELSAIEKEAKKKLNKLCTKINVSDKLQCETINKQGFAVDIILDTVKKKKVNLVVMGTKGASGMKEIFIGSNTAKVISKASCPVIAVPERNTISDIKKIVYATDFHTSDITSLKQLAEIASVFKAKISVIHIADKEYTTAEEEEYMEKFTQKVKQKVNYKSISCKLLYASDIEKKLEEYIVKEPIDLLAVSTKHRNLIERFFGKSITQKLAYHTKIPLIVFHYKQEPVVLI